MAFSGRETHSLVQIPRLAIWGGDSGALQPVVVCASGVSCQVHREESARAGAPSRPAGTWQCCYCSTKCTQLRRIFTGFSRRGRPKSFWRCPRLRNAHTSGLALTPARGLELSEATRLIPSHPPSLSEVVVPSATWSLTSHSQRLCHLRRTSSFSDFVARLGSAIWPPSSLLPQQTFIMLLIARTWFGQAFSGQ